MYGESETYEQAIEQRDATASGAWDTYASVSRASLTPPRLLSVAADPGRAAPHLVVADLRLPSELVRRRATDYANLARARGAQHSMKLWRDGYEQAVLVLARESANIANSARCEALFWEQRGGEYWVSATFSVPSPTIVH